MAGGRVGVRGTFRLAAAPPGVYLVVVEKVSPGARPVVGFGRLVRVRSGRTSVVPKVNPGSAARRTTAGVGGANGYGAASATKPAVAVRHFTGSGPQAVLGRGLAAVVFTELFGSRCYDLVEWEMRPEMLREIVIQQSRFGDPSTRITPRWIAPTVFVEGSVSTTASAVSWNIRLREIATGRIIGSDRGTTSANAVDAILGAARRLRAQLEKDLCQSRFTGSFSGRTRETQGGVVTLDFSYRGTVTFARGGGDSRPGFDSYSIQKIDYSTTITLSGLCTGTDTESASLGKNDEPGNILLLAKNATPGKGRLYEIHFTVQRPAPGIFAATCSGASVNFPWAPVAQIITSGAQFFTDANATRLQGTHNLPGSLTYTWNLAKNA